jgi:hypothetical protein
MQINAQLLYEATQEDYPQHCVQALQRITAEFEMMLNRTVGLMKWVVTVFQEADGDGSISDKKK